MPSRRMASPKSSSTALSLRLILAGLKSGLSTQLRMSLLPIAVCVLSSTHRSEPRFSFPRIVSSSSRFLRAVRLSFMYCLPLYISMLPMRSRPVFSVDLRYPKSAPAAQTMPCLPDRPNSSRFFLWNWFKRHSRHLSQAYSSSPASSTLALRRFLINPSRPPKSRAPWFMSTSLGEKRASSSSVCLSSSAPLSAEREAACISPVETSAKHMPALPSLTKSEHMKLFLVSSSMLLSSTVPGVITRIISRFTRPFASAGSSICSHMATLCPLAISFATYVS